MLCCGDILFLFASCIYFLLTHVFSSLPVLRRLGVLKEGREILKNENSLSMVKVWLALEVRLFINASIQDVSIVPLEITTLVINLLFSYLSN